MVIETERLIIRGFDKNDYHAVYEYTSNPDVMRYIPEGVFTKEDAKQFVEKNMGEKVEKYPVILKESNTLIGHIVFHRYFGEHTYEIGWVFHPDYYNNGFASEAAKAVLQYGFEELKLHRIIATCQPENIGSYRVMEKIGMRREGYFKKCIPDGDSWWDEYYYAILEEELRVQLSQTMNISLHLYEPKYREGLLSFELPNDQEKFTALPSRALDVQEGQFPIVIMEDNIPVGFFMLHSTSRVKEYSNNPNAMLLTAFSIDYIKQGRGYAKQGLRLLKKYIQYQFPNCDEIVLGVNHQNIPAQNLYVGVGFDDTGRRVIGSLGEQFVMSLRI